MSIRLHVDDPDLLRQAVAFTARETGFVPRLVEKDYFSSVVLEYLAASDAGLTFKGGTCLAKVHGGLYRLSEDLDFSIPANPGTTRASRSRSATRMRAVIEALPGDLDGFRLVEALRGANSSTQYNATIAYASLIDGHIEQLRIEVGLREPILTEVHAGAVQTALLSPVGGRTLVDAISVPCLSFAEAMAEKVRAALCRRDVAIRDFFDVDHVVQTGAFDLFAPRFVDLVRRKLNVPRTGTVDVTDGRIAQLQWQVDAQLRPVLREHEFVRFDLGRAVEMLRRVAKELE